MLNILKTRFLNNMNRHANVKWEDVETKLLHNEIALKCLIYMEETGGEPDVIGLTSDSQIIICDCSKESPKGRRSLCYDHEALVSRKKNAPASSVFDEIDKTKISLMDEFLYKKLQEVGEFDLASSSWILTPSDIREKGGALFCERRYGHVFVFHNGADSYYSNRGWRGYILI